MVAPRGARTDAGSEHLGAVPAHGADREARPLDLPQQRPAPGGGGPLQDIDWTQRRWNAGQAYAESKLYATTLAFAVARRWPSVLSNAVDPGWVPTKMGGPGAPDDLEMGHLTQTWLATSSDPAALTSGGYWHHRTLRSPAAEALDPGFQDRLLGLLGDLTGVTLF